MGLSPTTLHRSDQPSRSRLAGTQPECDPRLHRLLRRENPHRMRRAVDCIRHMADRFDAEEILARRRVNLHDTAGSALPGWSDASSSPSSRAVPSQPVKQWSSDHRADRAAVAVIPAGRHRPMPVRQRVRPAQPHPGRVELQRVEAGAREERMQPQPGRRRRVMPVGQPQRYLQGPLRPAPARSSAIERERPVPSAAPAGARSASVTAASETCSHRPGALPADAVDRVRMVAEIAVQLVVAALPAEPAIGDAVAERQQREPGQPAAPCPAPPPPAAPAAAPAHPLASSPPAPPPVSGASTTDNSPARNVSMPPPSVPPRNLASPRPAA